MQYLLPLIFYGILLWIIYRYRHKFEIQAKIIALYRTKIGIGLMEIIAHLSPRFWKIFADVGIVVGFLGMAVICYTLLSNFYNLLFVPDTVSAISLVIPGVKVPGSPVTIPFWYGIISIFVVAVIHEFSHGIIARVYNFTVKNTGIVFFGPIIGAFVEPDEKQMQSASYRKQLGVIAAGPFSNLVLALLIVLLFGFGAGAGLDKIIPSGVLDTLSIVDFSQMEIHKVERFEILSFANVSSAQSAGLKVGENISSINGVSIAQYEQYQEEFLALKPSVPIEMETESGSHTVIPQAHPLNASRGYLGVNFKPHVVPHPRIVESWGMSGYYFVWISMNFLLWLVVLNIGIGLANLLPLGPVDGGRMFQILLRSIFTNHNTADMIWKKVSVGLFLILLFSLLFPFFQMLL